MRRIWLYSLVAVALVVLIGGVAFGVGGILNSGDESRVGQVDTPKAEKPPASGTTEEKKKDTAKKKSGEKKKDEKAEKQKDWREIAKQRDDEEKAAAEAQAAEEEQPVIPTDTALSLTAPSAGIENDPVTDSVDERVLANGAGKIPSTGFPWQPGANTYIAAHVYGYPGTGSWQQFAGVPNMAMGDPIFLTASNGTTYEYQVSEILTVAPTDVWVVNSTGQNMVSLQTCVGPDWSERLVVRGTLVGTSEA
ncbi:hypothetical protein BH24ACT22_BH24ACT22_16750 [soil metagenome]